jgi:hypothetical protein
MLIKKIGNRALLGGETRVWAKLAQKLGQSVSLYSIPPNKWKRNLINNFLSSLNQNNQINNQDETKWK